MLLIGEFSTPTYLVQFQSADGQTPSGGRLTDILDYDSETYRQG